MVMYLIKDTYTSTEKHILKKTTVIDYYGKDMKQVRSTNMGLIIGSDAKQYGFRTMVDAMKDLQHFEDKNKLENEEGLWLHSPLKIVEVLF